MEVLRSTAEDRRYCFTPFPSLLHPSPTNRKLFLHQGFRMTKRDKRKLEQQSLRAQRFVRSRRSAPTPELRLDQLIEPGSLDGSARQAEELCSGRDIGCKSSEPHIR